MDFRCEVQSSLSGSERFVEPPSLEVSRAQLDTVLSSVL